MICPVENVGKDKHCEGGEREEFFGCGSATLRYYTLVI